jgi:hypothetical protein
MVLWGPYKVSLKERFAQGPQGFVQPVMALENY